MRDARAQRVQSARSSSCARAVLTSTRREESIRRKQRIRNALSGARETNKSNARVFGSLTTRDEVQLKAREFVDAFKSYLPDKLWTLRPVPVFTSEVVALQPLLAVTSP